MHISEVLQILKIANFIFIGFIYCMQVRFSKLHIVSKISERTKVQLAGKYPQNVLLPKGKADIYNPTYYRTALLGDIFNEICGIYSIEDIEKIAEE